MIFIDICFSFKFFKIIFLSSSDIAKKNNIISFFRKTAGFFGNRGTGSHNAVRITADNANRIAATILIFLYCERGRVSD